MTLPLPRPRLVVPLSEQALYGNHDTGASHKTMAHILSSPLDMRESMLGHMSFLRDSWTPESTDSPYMHTARTSGVKTSIPPSRGSYIMRRPVPIVCGYCGYDNADTELSCSHFAHAQCIVSLQDEECSFCNPLAEDDDYNDDAHEISDEKIFPPTRHHKLDSVYPNEFYNQSQLDLLRSDMHFNNVPSLSSRASTVASSIYDESLLIDAPRKAAPLNINVDGESSKSYLVTLLPPIDAFKIPEAPEISQQLGEPAFEAAKRSGLNFDTFKSGSLRLANQCKAGWSTDDLFDAKAFLFSNAIVLCRENRLIFVAQLVGVGFESSVKLFPDGNVGLCVQSNTHGAFFLQFSQDVVWQWQASLLHSLKSIPPLPDGFVTRPPVKMLVCLPARSISALSGIISRLEFVDRVSVATYALNWCTGFHSPDWHGWKDVVAGFEVDKYYGGIDDLVSTASCCILVDDGSPECPQIEGPRIHSVVLDSPESPVLAKMAIQSGGSFTTGNNLTQVLEGIAAAEKSYTHHNVVVTIKSSRPINSVKGFYSSIQRTSKNICSVNVGSLRAGSAKSIFVNTTGRLEITASSINASTECPVKYHTRADPDFSNFNAKILLFKVIQMTISVLEGQKGFDLVSIAQYLSKLSGETEEDYYYLEKARTLANCLPGIIDAPLEDRLQALFVLRTGFAVTGRTDIERTFFEDLETNVI